MDGAFPSKAVLKRAMDSMFEPNPWYYKLKKEVRKKMAINYKKEWEKLQQEYGRYLVSTLTKDKTSIQSIPLNIIMDNQIRDTIEDREKLMEKYAKTLFTTEIVKSKKDGHLVEIRFKGGPAYGKLFVTKEEFSTWLENRKEVK